MHNAAGGGACVGDGLRLWSGNTDLQLFQGRALVACVAAGASVRYASVFSARLADALVG